MKHRVRRRMTRSGKRRLLTVIIVLLLIFLIAAGGYYAINKKNTIENLYINRINELELHIADNTRHIYAAAENLKAGTVISADNVLMKEVLSDDCSYISEKDFGKTLLVDVAEGELLFKVFLSESVLDTGLREVEYDFIDISSNISVGDYVDIRILYPDGTDFIIVSKKQIVSLNDTKLVADILCFEEEILLLDSAAVDAYLFEGSRLYVTKYIMPSVQEPSVVNYVPSFVTAELIKDNPNIVTVASKFLSEELRKKRESALANFLDRDSGGVRYDENGIYIGTPTDAEMMAEDMFSSDKIPGTELPQEFGSDLWDE